MKRKIKKGLIGTIICAVVLALTSCDVLAYMALIFLTGGYDLSTGTTSKDSDYVEKTDDESVKKFSSSTSWAKLENFHGDLSSISKKTKNLYTVQVNRASVEKFNTGYVIPYNYSGSRSAERYAGLSPVIDQNVRVNHTPAFVTAFNENPGDYLTADSVPASRATIEGISYGGGSSSSSSSSDSSTTESVTYSVGSKRKFYIAENINSTNNGATKTATLKYKGDHCLIYLADETYKVITKGSSEYTYSGSFTFPSDYFENLAKVFDGLYNNVVNVMGKDDLSTPITLNGTTSSGVSRTYTSIQTSSSGDDSKLVIFINDLFDDKLGSSSGSVLGYYWAGDLYKTANMTYSNQCKMIYVDAYNMQLDILNNSKVCESTLVHEFTHMLNRINLKNDYKTWFTEMLAMTAEDIMSSNLEIGPENESSVFFQRLPYFNVTYKDGFSEEVWGNVDVTSAYSNTYAFGAYLLRNYGGLKLINAIATGSEVNEAAITAALSKVWSSSETFDTVLSKWGQVLCNFDTKTTKNSTSSSYITLNRTFTDSFNSTLYKIQNVDLSQYTLKVKDDYGNLQEYTGPIYSKIDNKYSIGGYGIEVKNFGEISNYQTFDAQLPMNKSCDLYIYIK